MSGSKLEDVFDDFCRSKNSRDANGVPEMDNGAFAKLCRDTGICKKYKLSSTSVDIIFNAAKPKGARRINFPSFKVALRAAAKELNIEYEELAQLVDQSSGPVFSGTQGTGFTASTLSRKPSIVDEFKNLRPPPQDTVGDTRLKMAFETFSTFGGGDSKYMPNDKFIKMCKDTNVCNAKYTVTQADLIFNKVKPRNDRRLTYTMFKEALNMISFQKGLNYNEIVEMIVGAGDPINTGTKAEKVKFHDDKSLYTGMYAEQKVYVPAKNR